MKVSRLSGRIHLIVKIKTGKIRISFGNVQIADPSKSRSIWSLSSTGIITFFPNVKLGTGTRLDIRGRLKVGDNVWVCAKSTVLKGGNIGNNTVVSANSNVVKPFSDSDIIIGGNPAKTLSTMKDKKFIH